MQYRYIGYVWLLAAYRQTHSPGRLAWFEGWQPLGVVPHSSYKPGSLAVALSYDDSTIIIVVVIIIIIIIIIITGICGSFLLVGGVDGMNEGLFIIFIMRRTNDVCFARSQK